MPFDAQSSKTFDDDVQPPGCCLNFWGPFRPLFGGVTIAQAATSVLFPTICVAIWRAVFAIFLGATFTYVMISGDANLLFYSSWCHLGLAVAFLVTGIFSFAYSRASRTSCNRSTFLAFAVVALFQIFASAALFLDVVYFALLYDTSEPLSFSQATQHVVNLGLVLLDLFLCLRMDFRLLNILLFVLYTAVYLLFAWVQFWVNGIFPYSFLDHRDKGAGLVVGIYIGVIAWGIAAAVIMVVVSRLSRCFSKSRADRGENLGHVSEDSKLGNPIEV